MALKVIGKVHSVGQTQQIASKNGGQPFLKREIVLDATRYDGLTGERGYDNFPLFEFSGDKCAELDAFKRGDVVEVSFELQGSFYKDKDGVERNFTRVRAYKIETYAVKSKPAPQPQAQQTQTAYQQPPMPSDYPPPPPPQQNLPW
jgi:hypothetical protein